MKSVTFSKLKADLKQLAETIRVSRREFKNAQRNGQSCWKFEAEMSKAAYDFRHQHIAYCLLRGRTREQIERPVRNLPDEARIELLLTQYRTAIDAEMAQKAVVEREALLLGTG